MMAFAVRILVTLLIFILIFRHIDLASVLENLRQADPRYLAVGIAMQGISTLIASVRWHLVMQALGFGQDLRFYLRSYFKGMFFNQGLPTSIGGDALRVMDVARAGGHRKTEAFYGVFVDRVLGLSSLLLLNLFAFVMNPALLPPAVAMPISAVVAAGVFGFVLFYHLRRIQALAHVRGVKVFHELSERMNLVFTGWRASATQLVLSVTVHIFTVVGMYMLGRGVGLGYDLATYMVIVPPVLLLTVVPISLAGWGVREGAMIGLFLLIGADKSSVLSMSVLYGLVLIVISLPGLYIYLTGKHRI